MNVRIPADFTKKGDILFILFNLCSFFNIILVKVSYIKCTQISCSQLVTNLKRHLKTM